MKKQINICQKLLYNEMVYTERHQKRPSII